MRFVFIMCIAGFGIVMGLACSHHSSEDNSCPTGELLCNGICIDGTSDPSNCGMCGTTCAGAAPFCQASSCVATCAAGALACGNSCVDASADPNNCGACGHTCAINEACTGSVCVPGTCRGQT